MTHMPKPAIMGVKYRVLGEIQVEQPDLVETSNEFCCSLSLGLNNTVLLENFPCVIMAVLLHLLQVLKSSGKIIPQVFKFLF